MLPSLTSLAMSDPVAQVDVRLSLGSLLLGTYFNSCLYTFQMLFTAQLLFTCRRKDSRATKAMLVAMALVSSIDVLASYASVYLYGIIHYGSTSYLASQYWPIPVYILTTSILATGSQAFLARRLYKLSKSWLALLVVAVFSICSLG